MKQAARPPAERVIRRYENRKLYDAHARRYVTLDGLGRLVAGGTEVKVVDQPTGEDITTMVLAQVVLEGIRRRTASIPHQVLTRIIRLGSGRGGGFPEWLDPLDASARAKHEAEHIVAGLVARGRLSLDEALALRHEIAESAQRLVAEAQAGVQAGWRRFEALLAPPRAPARRRAAQGGKKS
jgi:polyhydroxyalkanoate synthesis repressor PhaR